ncbi:hypothetical protein TNCV_2940571 [Trichonephila clavipes]|nr:hypothetical protein TNCV_2940571 [Trichonephila clavipes]
MPVNVAFQSALSYDSGLTPGVMVWGAISYHERSNLLRIESNLNNNSYSRALGDEPRNSEPWTTPELPPPLSLICTIPHQRVNRTKTQTHVSKTTLATSL